MSNTPMVIMWENSDNTVTLSQRMAPTEEEPTVQSNPPRIATFDQAASSLSGGSGNTNYSFTIPVRPARPAHLIRRVSPADVRSLLPNRALAARR